MSFRRGNRIAYAAVNGKTGKVYSDIPISLPAFWIGSFAAAIPIFLLLNGFVTLQPKNGLFAACFLALAGAVLYAGSYISILRREEHLDDAGYQFRGPGAGTDADGAVQIRASATDADGPAQTRAAGGSDSTGAAGSGAGASEGVVTGIGRWITGHDSAPAVRLKRDWVYYVFKAFTMWPYILMLILTALFAPTVFGVILTAGCAIYCSRKGGGKISFWSGLLIAVAAAGLVMRELPLVSDLWYYGGTAAVFLIVVIALTRLVFQYNLLSTRPLPLLFKDGKAPGDGGKGGSSDPGGRAKAGGAMSGLVILAAGALALQLLIPFGAKADGTPDGVRYTDAVTGYSVVISDGEDLLTDEEEDRLLTQMQGLTQYGNAVFVSCSQSEYDETLEYCQEAWEPTVSDWNGSDEWEAQGQLESTHRAHAIVEKLLDEAPESVLDEEQERAMVDYLHTIEMHG